MILVTGWEITDHQHGFSDRLLTYAADWNYDSMHRWNWDLDSPSPGKATASPSDAVSESASGPDVSRSQ